MVRLIQDFVGLNTLFFHSNFHEIFASPRMMKENPGATRGCLKSCKSIGALSERVKLIPATYSFPNLLPLSTLK